MAQQGSDTSVRMTQGDGDGGDGMEADAGAGGSNAPDNQPPPGACELSSHYISHCLSYFTQR